VTAGQNDWERWAPWDETLADGPPRDSSGDAARADGALAGGEIGAHGPDAIPEAGRQWLIEQRFAHGLLRAVNMADAQGREARIEAILQQVAADPAAARELAVVGEPVRAGARGPLRTVLGLAAAAVLAVGLWLGFAWWTGEPPLPTAEAMVARAVGQLQEPVDREFHVRFLGRRTEDERTARVVLRPGRLLVEGEGRFGFDYRLGCDGEVFWLATSSKFFPTITVPRENARRLESSLGEMIDVGYLDLQDLLERLPTEFRLETAGRVADPAGGPTRIRVVAKGLPERLEGRLEQAELWFEEASGMVLEIHVVSRPRPGVERRFHVEYRGEVDLDASAYAVPE